VSVTFILFGLLSCGISLLGTYFVRQSRLKKNLFDVPNDRSSHVNPTPRGGGAGIVVAVILCCFCGIVFRLIDLQLGFIVIFTSVCLAGIGWADDAINLSARRKLLGQFATGLIVVAAVNWHVLSITNLLYCLLGLIGFVWLTNLYNFMDGIDGIAGVQTLVVSVGSLIVFANA
jgi:Fuc2NAc and GlcNAc transferase